MSDFRISTVTAMPTRRKRLEHSRYVAEDVLAFIASHQQGHIYFNGDFGEIKLRINRRHRLFTQDHHCRFCGLCIEVACIDRDHASQPWQLHFYGIKDKELVMFTVDHIVPKGQGGKDTLNNVQTACQQCNAQKGNICTDPFAAAQIRYRGRHG